MKSKLELVRHRRSRISDFLASFNIFEHENGEFYVSTPFNSIGGYMRTRSQATNIVDCVIEAIEMLLNQSSKIEPLNIDSKLNWLNIEDQEGTGILSVYLGENSVLLEVIKIPSSIPSGENRLRIIWD
ncbi:MAG: hypothetical protein ACFFDI_29755 [Promethearchaeota archaeon]